MRRCIVPMDVFYERDKRKKLHAFAMTDGTPFGVARGSGRSASSPSPPMNWSGWPTIAWRPSFQSRSGLWARRTIFAEGEDFFSSLCYSI
jgi:hypothetical protein